MFEAAADIILPNRKNVLYTFDFFVPNGFVTSDTAKALSRGQKAVTFPGTFRCKDVYDTWWRGKQGCGKSTDEIQFVSARLALTPTLTLVLTLTLTLTLTLPPALTLALNPTLTLPLTLTPTVTLAQP